MTRLRAIIAWFILHPRTRGIMQFIGVTIGLTGVILALYFHATDHSQIKAERVAREAAAVAQAQSSKTSAKSIHLALCPLVYAYVHPSKGQNVPHQILAGWHAIGGLIGCPNGSP
jgi:hypothetical protein